MDVAYINAFVGSVNNLFTTMLACTATRGAIKISQTPPKNGDITALIGMGGHSPLTIALSFPDTTAMTMAGRLLGTEVTEVDADVLDAVCELVNIISGGAKAQLPTPDGVPAELSVPTVVRGGSYEVRYPSDATWIDIPFTSDLGAFSLRVASVKKKLGKRQDGGR